MTLEKRASFSASAKISRCFASFVGYWIDQPEDARRNPCRAAGPWPYQIVIKAGDKGVLYGDAEERSFRPWYAV